MARNMTPLVRAKAFGMMDAGLDNVAIAKELGVTRSAIWRLGKRREQMGEEKTVKGDWGKGGRKKVIGEREARWLRKAASDFPFDSANQLKARAPPPCRTSRTRSARSGPKRPPPRSAGSWQSPCLPELRPSSKMTVGPPSTRGRRWGSWARSWAPRPHFFL